MSSRIKGISKLAGRLVVFLAMTIAMCLLSIGTEARAEIGVDSVDAIDTETNVLITGLDYHNADFIVNDNSNFRLASENEAVDQSRVGKDGGGVVKRNKDGGSYSNPFALRYRNAGYTANGDSIDLLIYCRSAVYIDGYDNRDDGTWAPSAMVSDMWACHQFVMAGSGSWSRQEFQYELKIVYAGTENEVSGASFLVYFHDLDQHGYNGQGWDGNPNTELTRWGWDCYSESVRFDAGYDPNRIYVSSHQGYVPADNAIPGTLQLEGRGTNHGPYWGSKYAQDQSALETWTTGVATIASSGFKFTLRTFVGGSTSSLGIEATTKTYPSWNGPTKSTTSPIYTNGNATFTVDQTFPPTAPSNRAEGIKVSDTFADCLDVANATVTVTRYKNGVAEDVTSNWDMSRSGQTITMTARDLSLDGACFRHVFTYTIPVRKSYSFNNDGQLTFSGQNLKFSNQASVWIDTKTDDGTTKYSNSVDTEIVGYVKPQYLLQKADPNLGTGHPQGNTTLAGATYQVKYWAQWGKSGNPTWTRSYTTDSSGLLSFNDEMHFGTYEITETSAPTGYGTMTTRTVYVRQSDANGNMLLYRTDSDWGAASTYGATSASTGLISVEPSIRHGRVRAFKVDADSYRIGATSTYVVPEGNAGNGTSPNKNFAGVKYRIQNLSTNPVYVSTGNYGNHADHIYQKYDIIFELESNAQGWVEVPTNVLPYGTYKIYESTPAAGYRNSGWEKTFTISTDGQLVTYDGDNSNKEPVKRGYLTVEKVDKDDKTNNPQGDAPNTFRGVEYEIVNLSDHYVIVDDVSYNPGAVVKTIVANDSGVATTGTNSLPIGHYKVYESKTITGYLVSTWSKEFDITEDGTFIHYRWDQPNERVEDPVKRGGVKVQKADFDKQDQSTEYNKPQGDAGHMEDDGVTRTFKGTKYEIYNKSKHYVYVDNVKYRAPSNANDLVLVKTIYADENGLAQTANNTLPYGTYLIREVEAVEGYLLSNDWEPHVRWERTFSIHPDASPTDDHQVIDYTTKAKGWNDDPVMRGGITIYKVDRDTGNDTRYEDLETVPQGDAGKLKIGTTHTFAGTKYWIWNRSDHSVYIRTGHNMYKPELHTNHLYAKNEVCIEIVADENGIARTDLHALPYGSYFVQEVAPAEHYENSNWSAEFQIRSDGQLILYDDKTNVDGTQRNYEPVQRGGVSVEKEDYDWGTPSTQGSANRTFAGTEYTIYNKSDSYVYVDGEVYAPNAAVKVITADDTGVATTGNYSLPYGRYQIKETKAVEGYLLNLPGEDPWTRNFSITANGYMQYFSEENGNTQVKDHVIRMGLEIHKVDKDTGQPEPQGSATSLAGATYVVTTLSPHDVYINGTNCLYVADKHTYAYGERCAILTSGADGVASLPADTFPYGTYEVMEIDPPAGYLNSYWKHTFTVGENGIQDNGKTIVFDDADQNGKYPRNEEPIARGSVTVAKVDLETGSNIPQGDATLEGTVYEIKNMSNHEITIGEEHYAHGAVCMTITSDTNGVATTGNQGLPYGTYDIYEKTPPEGYRNNGWYRSFTIDRNSSNAAFVYSTGDKTKNEEPVERLKTGVQIRKVDADYRDESAEGSATLAGAVFVVRNESKHPVMVGTSLRAVGDVVLRLTTDSSGYAYILANTLPCGTYEVTEESAPTGYLRNSSWKGTLKVGADGTPSFYEGDTPVDALVCPDPVIRGDLKFRKVAAGTNTGLPGIAFNIKSVTTGEEHIAITNENGLLDTSSSFASRENDSVNANDAAVSYANIDHIWVIDESALSVSNGIWFNGRKPGTVTPSNAVGALPYDTYEIEELRCDANRDYELVAPFRITINSVGYATASEVIEDPRLTPPPTTSEHGNRVTIYKDADPAPNSQVSPNQVITYSVIVRNTGADVQRYTLVRDYIPQGTEYVPSSVSNTAGNQGVYMTPDGGQSYVEWKVENLRPREERILTFQVKVLYEVPQYVQNTAYCTEMATDFTPGNPNNPRPSEESNTVYHKTGSAATPSFVRVIKTSDPAPGTQVAWNTEIDYTLTVENTGGTTALMTGVYDKVPYGTELVSYTTEHVGVVSGTPGNQGVGWMIMVLEPGKPVELKMRVRVTDRSLAQSQGIVWNQASWGDLSNIDYPTTPTNDLSNTTNIIDHPLYEAPPETSDTYKSSEPAPETIVSQGETIHYTLTTTNSLVRAKPYVLVRDYIPEHTTYVPGSASDGGVYVDAVAESNTSGRSYIEWVLSDVKPREAKSVSFDVTVTDGWASYIRNVGYSQTYDAPVVPGAPTNPEPDTRTNEIKHRTTVTEEPEDLFPVVKVVKSSDPEPGSTVIRGQEITYYLDVTNDGKATAYDVMVFDATPLGTEIAAIPSVNNVQSTTMTQGAGAGWLIKELGIGKSVRLSYTVKVTGEGGSEVIRNQAKWIYENIPGDTKEPPVADDGMPNESNVVEHRLSPGVPPQLGSYVTCYKDAKPAPNSVVMVGDEVEYIVEAKNTGARTQDATMIRDYIPDGTSYVEDSATDGGVYVPADKSQDGKAYVEWVIGALAPLESKKVSFKVTIEDGYRTYFANHATFGPCSPNDLPGDPKNPAPTDPTNVVWHTTDPEKPTPAVVQVVKSSEPAAGSEIDKDATIKYTLHVTNTGNSVAYSYGVYDAVPKGLEVVPDSVSKEYSGTLAEDGSYVAWLVTEILPGKTIDLTYEATLVQKMASKLQTVENQATWGPSEGVPAIPMENTSNIVEHIIRHEPVPVLTKEHVGKKNIGVGDETNFVIKVKNTGDAPMTGWSLVDIPPEQMRYLADDALGMLREDGSVLWLLNLYPGEEKVVTVRMSAVEASTFAGTKNVAVLNDDISAECAISTADVVIGAPKQAGGVLLQTGVGAVSGVAGIISGALLSYDLVKRRRMVA